MSKGQVLKHLSKYVRLELMPIDLEEFNGDKEAYLLYMIQNELSDKHIAQFGKERKTILIFEKETIYPLWQGRIPHSWKPFFLKDNVSATVVFHLPKVYLATREKQHIIIKIKKVNPQVGTKMQVLEELILGKKLARWNEQDQTFEIYEYSQWTLAGLRYRSEM